MKADEAKIVVSNGQEYVETADGHYGLGLQWPAVKTQIVPTLATMTPLLSIDEVKRIIEASDFKFGREHFDDSWLTNQNGFGSCASYAGSSALAKARVLGGQARVDLSGDYLYSLVNGGRDAGSMLDRNMKAMMSQGVASKATVGLGGIYPRKYDKAKADAEARRFRGHELYAIPDEQSLATALALRIPTVIAIHVGGAWRKLDGDVLVGNSGPGNHSEHLDDIRYNNQAGRFEFREGSSHARPYFWVYWSKHFAQTSRNHQFYAVPSALDDPQGDNPGGDTQPAPVETVKLVRQSSSGCVWCDRWKQTEEPQVREANIELVDGNVPGSGVPRFTLQVGDKTENHVGFWSFDEIQQAVARLGG